MGTIGSPGSGKSYFSEKLARDLHFVHLRSDDIRFRLVKKVKKVDFSQEENDAVFGFMDFLSEKILKDGVGVIYDANLVKRTHRDRLCEIAQSAGVVYVILWIQTPLELAITRAKEREFRPIDREVVESLNSALEEPSSDEPIIIIDGTKSYEEQREFILNELKRKRFV